MNQYRQDVPQAQPAADNRGFLFKREAGVSLPLLQAAVTGFLVAVVVYILVIFALDFFVVLDGWKYAGGLAGIVGAIVTLKQWLEGVSHWVYNSDLHVFPPVAAAPEAPVTKTQHMIELDILRNDKSGYKRETATFTLSDALMVQVAQVLLSRKGFTERGMTGKGKLLTPKQWDDVVRTMDKARIIELVNPREPRQGWQLTDDGEQIMRKWLEQMGVNPSPTQL